MSDISINKAVEQKPAGVDLGADFEVGARDGGAAVGGNVSLSLGVDKIEKTGDFDFSIPFTFGAYSIARSHRIWKEKSAEWEYPEDCEPGFSCEPARTDEAIGSLENVETHDLAFRLTFGADFKVGIGRAGPGVFTFGIGPKGAVEYLKQELGEEHRLGGAILAASSFAYRLDMGLEVAAGASVDILTFRSSPSDLFSDNMYMGNVGVSYLF